MTTARDSADVRVHTHDISFGAAGLARRIRNVATIFLLASFSALVAPDILAGLFHTSARFVVSLATLLMALPAVAVLATPFIAAPCASAEGWVCADRDGLGLERDDHTVRIAREDLAYGSYSKELESVHFVRRNGDFVRVRVRHRAEGESLLRALGLDGRQGVLEFSTGHLAEMLIRGFVFTGFSAVVAGLVALLLSRHAGEGTVTAAFCVTLLTVLSLAMSLTAAPRIAVGTDGIRVERPFRTTFFAFAGLDAKIDSNATLRLARAGEREYQFTLHALPPSARTALADRIAEAQAAHDSLRTPSTAAADQIERKGRTVADWTRELVQLVKATGGYRTASVALDELLKIVADPNARADRRIGAAIAVRERGDEAAVARVRVAVDACASEPLKRALQNAVEGTLDDGDVDAAVDSQTTETSRRSP